MLDTKLYNENNTFCILPKYTVRELRERVAESMQEIREGKGQTADEFFEEIQEKYPWVSK